MVGLEQPSDFPTNSAPRLESGAKSGAPDDGSATMADVLTAGEPAPGFVADPLLTRFLDVWERLSCDDRLQLVEEAERLSDGV